MSDVDLVEVEVPGAVDEVLVELESIVDEVLVEIGLPGPPGPPGAGGAGAAGFEFTQLVPMATWTIPLPLDFGRRPSVEVYVGDERVFTDVSADQSNAVLTFAAPVAGTAIIT